MANLDINGLLRSLGEGSTLCEADLIADEGSNFIRYESGLQISWGYYDNVNYRDDMTGITANFGKPFATIPTFICSSGKTDGTINFRSTYCNYYSISTSSATFGWYGSTAFCAGWIAIGRWK